MFKNHLKIAYRTLIRNLKYSVINIGGLALGIAATLLICQYIYFELSYDTFHSDHENTYRVILDRTQNGEEQGADPYTSYAFAERAIEAIPAIQQYVRVYNADESAIVTNPENSKVINENAEAFFFADTNFWDMFNFPLKYGNEKTALSDIYNILLSEETAEKYFGQENPVGKALEIAGGNSPGTYTVSGVFKKLPQNSHLQFQFLMPINNIWELGNGGSVNRYDGWARIWFGTYFSLNGPTNISQVQSQLDELIAKYRGKWINAENVVENARLLPISDIHLKSEFYSNADYVKNYGSIRFIWIFSGIAVFILLIAWVNYINLATANSMLRSKEVGVRKSIGALQKQLRIQFMVEALLVNLIAGVLGIILALSLLPLLRELFGNTVHMNLLQFPIFWVGFLSVVIFGSLLSGFYPAFLLSSLKPTAIFKSNVSSRGPGNFNLRKGLIVFQFLVSLLMISATYLLYKQVSFMKNKNLGIDMEQIVIIKGPKVNLNGPKVTDGTDMEQIRAANAYNRSRFQDFKQQVSQNQSIISITGSKTIPGRTDNISRNDIRKFGEPENQGKYGRLVNVDLDFLETFDLELIAGNPFNDEMSDNNFLIINEEAVLTYGLESPVKAVEEKIMIGSQPTPIVGVVKNFHWSSLKDPHTPFLLRANGSAKNYISVKINLSNFQESMNHVQSVFETIYPGNAFEHFFLKENFNLQYASDTQFGNIFLVFSILAIFIACIGLFALVSYTTMVKRKEIGIRKVLGANVRLLMLHLSKEYLVLLLIATALAIPTTLYLSHRWLENYAFRTTLGMDLFILPVIMVVVIALSTIGQKIYRAANINPVKNLRTE